VQDPADAVEHTNELPKMLELHAKTWKAEQEFRGKPKDASQAGWQQQHLQTTVLDVAVVTSGSA
jgi:hypothetical protein